MRLHSALIYDKLSQIALHFFVTTLLLVVALGAGKSARADEYLDALKNESNELQYLEGGKEDKTNKSEEKEMNIGNFENFLEKKDAAVFSIYETLATPERLRVFNTYKNTGDYSKAEQLVHELHISHN